MTAYTACRNLAWALACAGAAAHLTALLDVREVTP